MPRKRIIHARDIVNDIRAGLTDDELMRKYRLSAKGLQSTYEKLMQNRIMTVHEIYGQPRSVGDDTVIVHDMRDLPRHYLTVDIPIQVADDPNVEGLLRDITERGLGIRGIAVNVEEVKSFVIGSQAFLKIPDIKFEAKCLWSEPGKPVDRWRAGFQITRISPTCLIDLRKLIKGLTLEE